MMKVDTARRNWTHGAVRGWVTNKMPEQDSSDRRKITIPDALLDELDSFAQHRGLSRGDFLKEAAEKHRAQLAAERQLRRGRRRR